MTEKPIYPEGLKVEYYRNNSLSGEASVRMEEELLYDPVHKPDRFQPEAPMSIRWTGQLKPIVSGVYTLGMKSDDGCRVYVDGKKVIDAWTEHSVQMDEAMIKLEAWEKRINCRWSTLTRRGLFCRIVLESSFGRFAKRIGSFR